MAFLGDSPCSPHLIAFADPPGHDELDHAALVALGGHGPPQSLHGFLVGFAQQRLSIYSYQLVIHSQPSILGGKQAERVLLKQLQKRSLSLKITSLKQKRKKGSGGFKHNASSCCSLCLF